VLTFTPAKIDGIRCFGNPCLLQLNRIIDDRKYSIPKLDKDYPKTLFILIIIMPVLLPLFAAYHYRVSTILDEIRILKETRSA